MKCKMRCDQRTAKLWGKNEIRTQGIEDLIAGMDITRFGYNNVWDYLAKLPINCNTITLFAVKS